MGLGDASCLRANEALTDNELARDGGSRIGGEGSSSSPSSGSPKGFTGAVVNVFRYSEGVGKGMAMDEKPGGGRIPRLVAATTKGWSSRRCVVMPGRQIVK